MSPPYLHIHTHQRRTCSVSPATAPGGGGMTGWQVVMCDGPSASAADTGAVAPVHTPHCPLRRPSASPLPSPLPLTHTPPPGAALTWTWLPSRQLKCQDVSSVQLMGVELTHWYCMKRLYIITCEFKLFVISIFHTAFFFACDFMCCCFNSTFLSGFLNAVQTTETFSESTESSKPVNWLRNL